MDKRCFLLYVCVFCPISVLILAIIFLEIAPWIDLSSLNFNTYILVNLNYIIILEM